MKITSLSLATAAAAFILVLGVSGIALAGSGKDGPDANSGGGNEPHAPGQTSNPNPGKLWQEPTFSPAQEMIILAQGVNDPPGKPSGPQGPGQHGSPGPNGNSGP